jgi:carboxypeptidase family protein
LQGNRPRNTRRFGTHKIDLKGETKMVRTDFWASRTRTVASICFALVCLSVIFMPAAFAQTSGTGALAGTVRDSSGGVVPNATVTATDLDTNQSRTSTTGADGTYRFGFLIPGHYSLQIEASGFRVSMIPTVEVTVTETAVADGTLQVGSQSQQVEVNAEAEAIQTTGAAQGTVLSGSTIADIPLTVRNYTTLLGLSAGANASVANAGALGRGTQEIATNGLTVSQNNYSMDGASVVNPSGSGSSADGGGSTGMGVVNPDAIQEFKIQTSMFDAGYGRNPGASVNVVTKSGTNSFHGSAFEFFRNTVLNANDFFRLQNPAPNNSEPILNQNQYGGTFGGPIKKDKLFIFAAYQETYQKNGFTIYASGNPVLPPLNMPGAVQRTNDATYRAYLGSLFCPTPTCPAATGGSTTAGGVQVDPAGANISQVAMNLLNLKNPDGSWFIPSSPNSGYQGTTLSQPARYEEHQAVGNFDYIINGKNTLSGRWFISLIPQSVTFGCGVTGTVGVVLLPCLPDDPGSIYYKNQYSNLKLTTLLSNNLVNEARISLQQAYADLANTGPFSDGGVGITSMYPGFLYTPGNDPLGTIIVKGSASFQFGAVLSLSNYKHTSSWEVGDQISWSHGKHTIRAGGEFERDRINWNLAGVNIINLTFNSFQDFLIGRAGCPASTPAGLCTAANPPTDQYGQLTNGSTNSNILSTGTTAGATDPGGLLHQFRNPAGDAFVQDDFKVNTNLTVSFGLRWEYDSLVQDSKGQEVDFWPSLANLVVPGPTAATGTLAGWVTPANYNPSINPAPPVGGVYQNTSKTPVGHNTPLDNFAPRLGVAWKPFSSDRFVVRSGAGFFYDRLGGLAYATAIAQSVPYALTLGASGAGTLNSSFSHPYPPTPPSWTPRFINYTGAVATSTSSNLATIFIDPNFTTPTTYEWNLDTQYEFASRWILEVAYVGSRSLRQWPVNTFAYNTALLTSPSNPDSYDGQTITTNSKANISYRVPYLGFAATGVTGACTCTDTKFNSLQATLHKQFSHGLLMQAAYTWSRTLTDTNYAIYNIPGPGNWGPSIYYHPQRLTLNYSYQLPFGKHTGLMDKLAGGWSVAGVTVVQDGVPLTPIDTRAGVIYGQTANSTDYSAQFAAGMGPANAANPAGGNDQNRLGCANTITTCPNGGWFNRAAFTAPPASPAASDGSTGLGNSGFGYILGPGQFNFDTVLVKNTVVGGIREGATLEFRTELFNTFNHPQFNAPSGLDASKVTFGQINSESVNPRLIQFALKYVF